MATNWEPESPYTAYWRHFQQEHPCLSFAAEVLATAGLFAANIAVVSLLLWAIATNGNK